MMMKPKRNPDKPLPKPPKRRVYFRDEQGRFVANDERYTEKTYSMQEWTGAGWSTRWSKLDTPQLTPDIVAMTLSRDTYWTLSPVVSGEEREFTTNKPYQAWELGKKLDKALGKHGGLMKITVDVQEGKRKKSVSFYDNIKPKSKISYRMFRRINEELGRKKMFLYSHIKGKKMRDRIGSQVRIIKVKYEEMTV